MSCGGEALTVAQFFNAVLYASTPEMFPAYVRGSACGLASTMGRLSGVSAAAQAN